MYLRAFLQLWNRRSIIQQRFFSATLSGQNETTTSNLAASGACVSGSDGEGRCGSSARGAIQLRWRLGRHRSRSYKLNRVCAASRTVLRHYLPGEPGVVIRRYQRVAGYDWLAIPLNPISTQLMELGDVPVVCR